MKAIKYSARHFNVQMPKGSIEPPVVRFTTGYVVEIDGQPVAVSDDEVVAAALRILSQRMAGGHALVNPQLMREYLSVRYAGLEYEVFSCLFLDGRARVIACGGALLGAAIGVAISNKREGAFIGAGLGVLMAALVEASLRKEP